jgi:two-component system, chemotaxis family, chemotaxis protein CheY
MRQNNRMPVEVEGGNGRAILIVEDSENSAAVLEMAFLEIPNVKVVQAASGVEALRILNAAATPVKAVVTDLNMPRMDGFELIRRIRGDQRLRATPIIVVSADVDPETPRRVAALGADAFFPKPFSPAQVRRALERLLNGTKH